MWNLKPKIRLSLSTPLTSIPLQLWSIGKLNRLLTPNASNIEVVIYDLFSVMFFKVLKVVCLVNDLNTQTVSQFNNYN